VGEKQESLLCHPAVPRAKLNEVITGVELTEMQQRVWLLIGVHSRSWTKNAESHASTGYVCALFQNSIYYHIFFTSPLLDVDAISSLRTWSGRATRGTVMTGYPRSRTSVKISHEFQSACIVLGARRSAVPEQDSRSLLGGGAHELVFYFCPFNCDRPHLVKFSHLLFTPISCSTE